MIRSANDDDTQAILDIWLAASIAAHDFVPAEFWRAQLDDMRMRYLPASQAFVYEQEGRVAGFHALSGHTLAALFVQSEWQGRGIGTALLSHARRLRGELTLSVYLANQPSVQFYLAQGFETVCQRVDAHTGQLEWLMRARPID